MRLIEKIAEQFAKEGIQYSIVGGYAVALHGAIRGTIDIDLIIKHDKQQFEKTEKVLNQLGLVSQLPVSASQVFAFKDEYIKNRNLIAWSFYNPENPIEVVDVILTVDFAGKKAVTKHAGGHKLKVLAIEDLIAMKKLASREQDLEDIKALESLR